MPTPAQAQLAELFQASQNLPNAYCELGRIQLGLCDLQRIAKSRSSSKQPDAKAHYLLAGSGFNAEQVSAEIATLQFESQALAPSTGVERYLTNKKLDGVYQSITKLVKQATHEFDQRLSGELSVEWTHARKRQIFELLGNENPPKALRSAAASSRAGKYLLGEIPRASVRLSTMHKAKDFGGVVASLVSPENGSKSASVAPATALASVANHWDAALYPQLVDTWSAVGLLVQGRKFHQQKPQLSETLASSRHALEIQYRHYIDEEINLRRKDAQLGGVPSPFNKIRAFVDLKYKTSSEVELINKTPIWAQLYFLVRCGYIKEADQLIKDRKDIFDYIETSFATYFSAWASGSGLTPSYQQLIASDYSTSFRPGAAFDPFKQALYKIVGHCDLSHKSITAAATTEDWLWLQLHLVRDGSEYAAGDLQQYIWKAGASNFEPTGTNPAKYFNLLVLVGLYEQAVEQLADHDEISAIHFAICLNYYGLLNLVASSPQSKDGKLVVYEGAASTPRFDFALAIARYTRLFRQQHPETAVDYLCLIAQNRDYAPVYKDWAISSIQELAIESRLFVELFGDALARQQGYMESRLDAIGISSRKQYLDELVLATATKVYEDGRLTDAIVLYHIGEDYNKVITMVNALVAQTLASTPLGQVVGRGEFVESELFNSEHPVDLAHNLLRIQEQNPLILQSINIDDRRTTQQLLTVASAMNALARGEYQRCFGLVESTGLVSTGIETDFATTRELANRFAQYSPSLAQIFPHLLEMVLVCSINIVKELRSSSPELVDQYRARAGNCIAFVGLIQYHMPSQVYSRLTRLESELGAL